MVNVLTETFVLVDGLEPPEALPIIERAIASIPRPISPDDLLIESRLQLLHRQTREPHGGVQALFNGDLARTMPDWAPRENWRVFGRFDLRHIEGER